jgi:hypothetical protein
MAAHFAYGAAMSSLVAVAPGAAAPIAGAGYGLLIWAGSYLGWLPSMHILKSATRHPPQRNALMGAVHLVWGEGRSVTLRELLRAQTEVFADGELRDARADRPGPGLDLTNAAAELDCDRPRQRSRTRPDIRRWPGSSGTTSGTEQQATELAGLGQRPQRLDMNRRVRGHRPVRRSDTHGASSAGPLAAAGARHPEASGRVDRTLRHRPNALTLNTKRNPGAVRSAQSRAFRS